MTTRKKILQLLLTLILCNSTFAYISSSNNFSISFPKYPEKNKFTFMGMEYSTYTYVNQSEKKHYGLICHEYPPNVVGNNEKEIYIGAIKGYIQSMPGITLKSKKIFNYKGNSGIEIEYNIMYNNQVLFGIRRFLLVQNKMYSYYGTGVQNKSLDPKIRRFLDSFKVL